MTGRQILRWALGIVGGLVALICVLVVCGMLWLRSDGGERWLAAFIERSVSTPDQIVTVNGLSGNLPFDIHVQHVAIADQTGVFATVDGVEVEADPWPLLKGSLHIERVEAATINLLRSPEASSTPEPTGPKPAFDLPHLPVDITVDTVNFPQIALAGAVTGTPASLKLSGTLSLTDAVAGLKLELVRLDEPGRAGLTARYTRKTASVAELLYVSADMEEPSGKLLAGLTADGKNRPVKVTVSGSGPVARWVGRLDGSIGDDASLWADMTLGRTDVDMLVSAKGNVHAAALLPETIRTVVGGDVGFDVSSEIADAGPIGVTHFRLTSASATLGGVGRYEPKSGALTALLDDETDLRALSALTGTGLAGGIKLVAVLSGTTARPSAKVVVEGNSIVQNDKSIGAAKATINLDPDKGDAFHIQADGQLADVQIPGAAPAAASTFTLDATGAMDLRNIVLNTIKISSDTLTVTASGSLKDGVLTGNAKLDASDLARFSGLAGQKLTGGLTITADATSPDGKSIRGVVTGGLHQFSTGIPAMNGLLGKEVSFNADLARDAAGAVTVNTLKLTSPALNLQGSGSYDPARQSMKSRVNAVIADLKTLGVALGTPMAGALHLTGDASGKIDALSANLALDGSDITAGSAQFDRVSVVAVSNDLSKIAAKITADITRGTAAAHLTTTVSQPSPDHVVLDNLVLTGPATSLNGTLGVDLKTNLVDGSLTGQATDLSGWMPFAGTRLGGSASVALKLKRDKGQAVDGQVSADNFVFGNSKDAISAGQFRLNAQLTNILVKPAGRLTVDAIAVHNADQSIDTAHLAVVSGAGSIINVDLASKGRVAGRSFEIAAKGAGTANATQQAATLTDLTATVDDLTTKLLAPLSIDHHADTISLRNLNADIGGGKVQGNVAYSPAKIAIVLDGSGLPIGKFAALAGRSGVSGNAAMTVALSGSPLAPKGHATISLNQWRVDQTTPLNVALNANIDGHSVSLGGTAAGNNGEGKLDLTAVVPVTFTEDFGVSVPRDGQIRGTLKGQGSLDALNQLLPLGEDRVGGNYAIDLSLSGTVARPEAGGRMTVTAGRYDNSLTGMTLRNISMEMVGAAQQFRLQHFDADDGTGGKITIAGAVDLSGEQGARLNIDTTLTRFMATRRDDVTAMFSGTTKISGTANAPIVTGSLSIERAEVNIPQQLPASSPTLDVIRIDSRAPVTQRSTPVPLATPFLATLDIKLRDRGQTFIRGDGLDSEWNGDLTITGTSSYPALVGTLNSINGTISVLGTTFTIERGAVTFTGATDPSFDIEAQAVTSGITAIAELQGTPSSPRIVLSSTPVLPQDEVLSRVMFGTSVGQITPTQGLQIAAAAASLASGGGPGVLDRIRNFTGLDRLGFGQDTTPTRTASGSTTTAGATVKGGKYVAPGIFVGVDQGITGGSTHARVEVTVSDHITVDAVAGTSTDNGAGSSLGISYKRDY